MKRQRRMDGKTDWQRHRRMDRQNQKDHFQSVVLAELVLIRNVFLPLWPERFLCWSHSWIFYRDSEQNRFQPLTSTGPAHPSRSGRVRHPAGRPRRSGLGVCGSGASPPPLWRPARRLGRPWAAGGNPAWAGSEEYLETEPLWRYRANRARLV